MRSPRPATPLKPWPVLVLALTIAMPSGGCGPRSPSPRVDPLELLETQVTEGAALARESAVALEYTASDAPLGSRRVASGVVINEEGDVLSVRIDRPTSTTPSITARVASGGRLPVTWVAADPQTGLTLLKIAPGSARPAVPATTDPLPGLPLLLVGNPFGLGHSVSRGYVAGTGRRLLYGAHALGGLIQVDTGLHPGDSGAPVTDLRGRWLGLIRSGLASPPLGQDQAGSPSEALQGPLDQGQGHDLGFAIPARDALWVAGQLRAHGKIERAFLGVSTRLSASPSRAEGVELTDVIPGSPAALAGLKPGDRIVALSGAKVNAPVDLTDLLDRTAAGDAVTVGFFRPSGANPRSPGGPGLPLLRETLLTSRRPRSPAGDSSPPLADAVAEPSVPPDPDLSDPVARLDRRKPEGDGGRDSSTTPNPEPGVARKP